MFFEVNDNGKGFSNTEIVHGNGLKNMQGRALEINAVFSIKAHHGTGTGICLQV